MLKTRKGEIFLRILMIVCLSFCVGAGLALLSLPDMAFWAAAGVLLLPGILLLCLKKERRLTLIFLSAAVGILFSQGYQYVFCAPAQSLAGQEIYLTGTAVDYSQPSAHGLWVESKLDTEAGPIRADVYLSVTDVSLRPGDRFSGAFSLRDSAGDGEYYGYSERIFLTAFGKKDVEITPAASVPLKYLPKYIAHRLETSVKTCFPADVQGYAMALTTGNRSGLSALDKANLKTSGIYHALALSGMHMAVLVGMLSMIFRKKRPLALAGIPVCILFAVITGGSPSVVRACIMECLLLAAGALKRESDWPTSLSFALLLLTLQNPWCLLSWGLQLSFLSVVGICLLSTKLTAWMMGTKKGRHTLLRRLKTIVVSAFSVTFSAMVATFPLMLIYFGCISLISPVTNLLTGTVISFCFGGSLLTALVGLVLPGVGSVMGWVVAWGFRYTGLVAGLLAKLPFAALYTDSLYGVLCLILVYGILLTLLLGKKKVIPVCCGVSGVSICLLLLLMESAIPSFTALDVGQGQCLVMNCGQGTVMVDCGGSVSNAGDTAAEYLMGRGVRRVELLILTHFDSDHVSGVTELLNRMEVDTLLCPDLESGVREEIEAVAEAQGTAVRTVTADMTAILGDSALQIFAPVDGGSSNDSCVSVLAELPALSVLITGDMDMDAEEKLMTAHSGLQADVLVAGHHGSKASTSEKLLEETDPSAVVISVGENTYGHPGEEMLTRAKASGATIYRTDQLGNVCIKGEYHWP